MSRARVWTLAFFLLLTWMPGCGGGNSSSPPPPPPPPPPAALTISTTSLPDATQGQNYNAQLQATGGSGTRTWSLTSGTLPANLLLDTSGHISGLAVTTGSFDITLQVQDSAGKTASKQLTLKVIQPPPPVITTSVMPDARIGGQYFAQLAVTNGAPPFTWTMTSGSLPSGISFSPNGALAGTGILAQSTTFTVQVSDLGGQTGQRTFTLKTVASLGRNDSISTATVLSNGTFSASLSPFTDGGISPDTDFYKLSANPGTIVALSVLAEQINTVGLDSVIEILDANGQRLQTCRDPFGKFIPQIGPPLVADPNPNDFDDQCVNDDDPNTGTTDSSLEFQVPGASGGPPFTFYVHVLDWGGRARPDLRYQLVVSGAN